MVKIEITPEISRLIRNERKKRNIRGDILSRNLGKTNTFISQIETQKISEIDLKLFYSIFQQIFGENDFESYMDTLLRNADEFKLSGEKDELEDGKAFVLMQERYTQLPITTELIGFIKDSLLELGMSGSELIELVNLNRFLKCPEKFNDNECIVGITEDNKVEENIKFNLDNSLIDDIISRKKKSLCFVFMVGIIFNIFIAKGENEIEANLKAVKLLEGYDFAPLYRRRLKVTEKLLDENYHPSTLFHFYNDEYSKEYSELLDEIQARYAAYGGNDVLRAIETLKRHMQNLNANIELAMSALSVPLFKIPEEDTVQFAQDFVALVTRYVPKGKDS